MAKSFFEVFPQLKLDTDLQGMLDDATVSKVSTTRQRNSLRIYLGCGRLLPKEKVYFLENELKRQLFPHHTMNIKIIEKFQLSEQYTLKNLLDVYWNSILTEFHRYSLLEYNLLRHAKLDVVEEKVLRVSLEDTVLAHQKEEEIYHILEKIFNERCNLSIQIEMEFHEKEASKYRKNADIKMQNEVENVIRLSSFGAKRHPEGEYMENPEAGASEVPWETGDSAAKPAKKQQKRKPKKQQLSKRNPLQQRKSLQNRKTVAVSKRALAENGISGIVVLTKDPIIRMWYTVEILTKKQSVSNRSWERWEKLSFVDRFCLWMSARSVVRKRF